jgi:hypothetical protein
MKKKDLQEYGQIVGPVCPFSLAVEISIRYCKILHDPVVASGSLPDMFLKAISEHNLETSIIFGAPFAASFLGLILEF